MKYFDCRRKQSLGMMYFPQPKCQETCLQRTQLYSSSLSFFDFVQFPWQALASPTWRGPSAVQAGAGHSGHTGHETRARAGGPVRGRQRQQVTARLPWHRQSAARRPAQPAHRGQALQLYHSSSESWQSANKRQRKLSLRREKVGKTCV